MKLDSAISVGLAKNIFALCLTTLFGLALSGCAIAPASVNYSPGSLKNSTGALSVSDFKYLPSQVGSKTPVAANQIRNTVIDKIEIDRDVSIFVRDAVFAELRFVGIKTSDPSKVLRGDIEELLIDDLGFNIDWTFRIKYTVTEATSNKILYQSVKNIQRKTGKANAFGALNETIRLSVEQLLDDGEFIKTIN